MLVASLLVSAGLLALAVFVAVGWSGPGSPAPPGRVARERSPIMEPPAPPPIVAAPIRPAAPSTADAVAAWELVRQRLTAGGMAADELRAIDEQIAPKLFPRLDAPRPDARLDA